MRYLNYRVVRRKKMFAFRRNASSKGILFEAELFFVCMIACVQCATGIFVSIVIAHNEHNRCFLASTRNASNNGSLWAFVRLC